MYNYHTAFLPKTLCPACLRELQVVALLFYKESHPGEEGVVKITVHLEQNTVEVQGSEVVFYTFRELGFNATC
jgi:hypothetical protein